MAKSLKISGQPLARAQCVTKNFALYSTLSISMNKFVCLLLKFVMIVMLAWKAGS